MTKTTTAVLVPCRINVDTRWYDACIHEIGPNDIVISTTASLRRGDNVQARRGTLTINGHVSWIRNGRIGIATQNSVSVGAMLDEPRHTARRAPSGERRNVARASSIAQAERSRQIGSAMQFAALTLATGGGAYLLVTQLYVALTIPLTRISAVLGS
ncbi:hypothetical protein SAMN05216382_0851 [Sphingomonas palmae]|uniref:Uncharacterized protein n=1 Tax=Sphingomonas palmae TaxID=1855283 RepID=A0A1H7IT04_9SPHN|nr:hypothetical protein [Sphingomonas palmae]SEK65042.1 hypothetical protein SAMN05216382_0851 [Sphingomonas palmae]